MFCFFFKKFLNLFLGRGEEREKEREREREKKHQSVSCMPTTWQAVTWPTTQARALTGNGICRATPNPLGRTSQGQAFCFLSELGEGVVVLEREPKMIN